MNWNWMNFFYSIVKPKALTGALEVNNHLDHAERVLEGKVQGPESLVGNWSIFEFSAFLLIIFFNFIAQGKSIFASLHNRNVVRIDGDHVTFIAKFGKPCEYPVEEAICGRPLGLALDTINPDTLIVSDAYYGLWELNVKTGAKKQLLSPEKEFGVKVNIKINLLQNN